MAEETQRRKEEAERLAYIAELEAKNRALEQRLTKSNTRGHAVVKLFEVTPRTTPKHVSPVPEMMSSLDFQVPASEVEVSPENFLARGRSPNPNPDAQRWGGEGVALHFD